MRSWDLIILAWRQLKERRLRTILTILAVSIGVVAIIVLSSQVESTRQAVLSTLESLGPNTLIIVPQGRMPFSDADVNKIRILEGVSRVIPFLTIKVRIPGLEEESVNLISISSLDLAELLGSVRLIDGSLYYDVPAPQAVIGYDIATNYNTQEPLKVGQPLIIYLSNGRTLTLNIVGVLDYYGTSIMMTQVDSTLFVPIEYVKMLARGISYSGVIVKASSSEYVDTLQEYLRQLFGRRVRIFSIKQVTTAVSNVMNQLSMLLISVAGTAFIAAGLGTFNIMMVSVLERVREIGILKAIGMKNTSVLTLYMVQGFLIGILGAIIGLALGVAGAYVIPFVLGGRNMMFPFGTPPGARGGIGIGASIEVAFNIIYISLAIMISIATSLVSAAYPAWRASKLNPIDALRYE